MKELRYSFQLSIEQDRESILELTVGAEDTAESVAKAKKTVQELLDEYVLRIQNEFVPRPEGAAGTFSVSSEEPPKNQKLQKSAKIAEVVQEKASGSSGTKGFVIIRCEKCGNVFRSFLRGPQKELSCKCGHHIDLTVPLANFEYTCECGKKNWGKTNVEDASIEVRCSCGKRKVLDWAPPKGYRSVREEDEETPDETPVPEEKPDDGSEE